MSDFKVGDKVEIIFHLQKELKGKIGKISIIAGGLLQGTNPLERNINLGEQDARFIITLEDNTVLGDIRATQLRKV